MQLRGDRIAARRKEAHAIGKAYATGKRRRAVVQL